MNAGNTSNFPTHGAISQAVLANRRSSAKAEVTSRVSDARFQSEAKVNLNAPEKLDHFFTGTSKTGRSLIT
jgi:hypothetical protein